MSLIADTSAWIARCARGPARALLLALLIAPAIAAASTGLEHPELADEGSKTRVWGPELLLQALHQQGVDLSHGSVWRSQRLLVKPAADSGFQYDIETGLTYARARYYDSELGRFISRDVYGGELNDAPSLHRYLYAHANPLRYVDPLGFCTFGQDCWKQFWKDTADFGIPLANRVDQVVRSLKQDFTTGGDDEIKPRFTTYAEDDAREQARGLNPKMGVWDEARARDEKDLEALTEARTGDAAEIAAIQREIRDRREQQKTAKLVQVIGTGTAYVAIEGMKAEAGGILLKGSASLLARGFENAAASGFGSKMFPAASASPLGISSGRAREIFYGAGQLSGHQKKILSMLPEAGSTTIIPKKTVSIQDLASLTAETGDEFAMFTTGGRRLIVRGTPSTVPIFESQARSLASKGWRFSGHTHPGASAVLGSSEGDRFILSLFPDQRHSSIYNSLGEFRKYTPQGDDLSGWLPK